MVENRSVNAAGNSASQSAIVSPSLVTNTESARHLAELQEWLVAKELDGVIVPSTDEFVSEFAPPANRRLRWATGFTGSTGVAIVHRRGAGLFLDARYRLQAMNEVPSEVEVEGAGVDTRLAWLSRSLPRQGRLGVFLPVHGIADIIDWNKIATDLRLELVPLASHPVDALWGSVRPDPYFPVAVDHPLERAGEDYLSKLRRLQEHIESRELASFLIADPEDVSWLLNVRAAGPATRSKPGDWHIVPSVPSRLLVRRSGEIDWFVDAELVENEVLKARSQAVRIAPPESLGPSIKQMAAEGPIAADFRRTPAILASDSVSFVADDVVSRWRWRKNDVEINAARHAHRIDAVAIVRFMAWLSRTVPLRPISEFDAAVKLEALRSDSNNYDGASMPFMAASGPNGANPHYVPTENQALVLSDHPIFWMDSGGHYRGGTTDNTLTMAVGEPAPKHRRAHTLVLKGFIALSTCSFPAGTTGLQLDPIARQPLWRARADYGHNTGHGVGAGLNIHEGPSIGRNPTPTSTVVLEPGMIVSNEPGFYADGDFGLRIESHMLVVPDACPGFLAFETISWLPIDPALVEFELLDASERKWLAEYHEQVRNVVGSQLAPEDAMWLDRLVTSFAKAVDDAPSWHSSDSAAAKREIGISVDD